MKKKVKKLVEIKNIEVFNLERAQRAIQNSFNVGEIDTTKGEIKPKLSESLGNNMQPHQSHDAYLKGILVTFDVKGNGAFMPEFQRYHHHEIIMSQSTMHAISKMIEGEINPFTKYVSEEVKEICKRNYYAWEKAKKERDEYRDSFRDMVSGIREENEKKYDKLVYESFMTLIHNLPRGLELWATINSNYLQLKTIVIQRFHHKQKEDWMSFIQACYSMPQFRELCGFTDEKWNLENW